METMAESVEDIEAECVCRNCGYRIGINRKRDGYISCKCKVICVDTAGQKEYIVNDETTRKCNCEHPKSECFVIIPCPHCKKSIRPEVKVTKEKLYGFSYLFQNRCPEW